MKKLLQPYTYNAIITNVYDGDTITADIDLGMNSWLHNVKLRLARINAPEVRGSEKPEGLISKSWLYEQLKDKEVVIKTEKDKKGKYGRYIAEIYLGGVNVNDLIVSLGLAEYKEY